MFSSSDKINSDSNPWLFILIRERGGKAVPASIDMRYAASIDDSLWEVPVGPPCDPCIYNSLSGMDFKRRVLAGNHLLR